MPWQKHNLITLAHKLFETVYQQKHHANHNHEIHTLYRNRNQWLRAGIDAIISGHYDPRHLRRCRLPDEVVDCLHTTDRVFQHLILKTLKPTFPFVMNRNCYHLHGPSGVKLATQRIKTILSSDTATFIIRADIKSYYRSISHSLLIQDIKQHYDDPKVHTMLENIIRNPIDTPNGCINPDNGIALRGPLSQFFSALYLKPLDDAFDKMDLSYLRYQDDILILCKTKRQMNRARRVLMDVLHQRGLKLSRKKSRMGQLSQGFHFLGIQYQCARTADMPKIKPSTVDDDMTNLAQTVHAQCLGMNQAIEHHQSLGPLSIRPHPRTLRLARLQVEVMVHDGFSAQQIRSYLQRFLLWWVQTSAQTWTFHEMVDWFVRQCWHGQTAAWAAGVLQLAVNRCDTK